MARGRHPGTPGASAVEFLVEMAMGRTTIRPDGRADYRNQDGMATVGKGQRIARVPAASLVREEGWDVLGAKLAPRSEEAGRVRARDGLETHHLGSDRGVRTVVEFGQDFLVADRIEREEREIEKLKREVTRVDLAIKEAERRGGGRRLDALHVQKLHAQKLQMLKLLERRGLRVFTYRERFEQHYPSHITVTGTLHPGVVFETHGRTLEITSPRRNVVIAFDPATGRIEERGATPATRGGP